MPSNEKLAIAAHLHVLLRRKTGRVTDPEWMASNADYACEIARFAKAKATQEGHTDLAMWAEKLEHAMGLRLTAPQHPLVQANIIPIVSREKQLQMLATPKTAAQRPHSIDTERVDYPDSGFIESTFGAFFGDTESQRLRKLRDPDAPRYVKGLR